MGTCSFSTAGIVLFVVSVSIIHCVVSMTTQPRYGRPGVEFRAVQQEDASPITEIFSFGNLVCTVYMYTCWSLYYQYPPTVTLCVNHIQCIPYNALLRTYIYIYIHVYIYIAFVTCMNISVENISSRISAVRNKVYNFSLNYLFCYQQMIEHHVLYMYMAGTFHHYFLEVPRSAEIYF